MKMIKTKRPVERNGNGIANKLRAIKAGGDDCVLLETAAEYRGFAGAVGALKKRHKMEFSTRGGSNGTVLVWRVK